MESIDYTEYIIKHDSVDAATHALMLETGLLEDVCYELIMKARERLIEATPAELQESWAWILQYHRLKNLHHVAMKAYDMKIAAQALSEMNKLLIIMQG